MENLSLPVAPALLALLSLVLLFAGAVWIVVAGGARRALALRVVFSAYALLILGGLVGAAVFGGRDDRRAALGVGGGLLLAGAAVFGVSRFMRRPRLVRAMRATPASPIGAVKDGEVCRIVGRVVLTEPAAVAPLSGRRCAFWEAEVTHDQRRRSTPSRRLVAERQGNGCLVEDHTGVARIPAMSRWHELTLVKDRGQAAGWLRPGSSELEAYLGRHRLTGDALVLEESLAVHEGALEEGETVTVLGVGTWKQEDGRRVLELSHHPIHGLVITDDPAAAR